MSILVPATLFAVFILALLGYILNVVKLVRVVVTNGKESDFLLRVIGLVIIPAGCVMGYL